MASSTPDARSPEEGYGLKAERKKAAIAYVLTWLTGLIVLLVADEDERYARWHAVQAIGLGVAFYILSAVFGMLAALMGLAFTFGFGSHMMWSPWWFGLGPGLVGWLLPLLLLVLIIVLALKAYEGETVRLPLLATLADEITR